MTTETQNGMGSTPNPTTTPTPNTTPYTTPKSTRGSTPKSTRGSTPERNQRSINVDVEVADRIGELARLTGQYVSDIVALGEALARQRLTERDERRITGDEWVARMLS